MWVWAECGALNEPNVSTFSVFTAHKGSVSLQSNFFFSWKQVLVLFYCPFIRHYVFFFSVINRMYYILSNQWSVLAWETFPSRFQSLNPDQSRLVWLQRRVWAGRAALVSVFLIIWKKQTNLNPPIDSTCTGGQTLPVALHNDKLEVNTISHSLNQLNVCH